MNEDKDYYELYLDSGSYDTGDRNNPGFHISPPIKNCSGIKLVGATIPFTWYVFNNYNNTFSLTENVGQYEYDTGVYETKDVSYSLTITPGNYNSTTILTELDTILASQGNFVYTIDSTNNKLNITESVGSTELDITLDSGNYSLTTLLTEIENQITAISLSDGNTWTYSASQAVGGELYIESVCDGIGGTFSLSLATSTNVAWYYLGLIKQDYSTDVNVTGTNVMPITTTTTYTSSFDLNSNKISIQSTVSEQFVLTFLNDQASPKYFLGGNAINTATTSGLLVLPNVIQLTGPDYLLLNGSIGTSIVQNIRINGTTTFSPPSFCKIPITTNPGGITDYRITQTGNFYFEFPKSTIQRLTFSFGMGDYSIPSFVDFNNKPFSLVIGVLVDKKSQELDSSDLNWGSKRVKINY